jgi:2-polyprenyl-6-hydroxyphenyl methylase/3-demethylubiquinone-9 3-methyltransferase
MHSVPAATFQGLRAKRQMKTSARNNLAIYDEVAADWWSDKIRWVRALKNLVPDRLACFDWHINWAGNRVLDLGCAGGFMAEALADRGAVFTGIDPAADAVDAARRHAAAAGRTIRDDVGLGEELPYHDKAFAAVVCVDALEHVTDLAKVLAEVERVLKPGGLFLFDTINRNPIASLATITVAEDILGLLPKGTHDPSLFIKPAKLRDAMTRAGLRPGPMTGLGPRGVNRRGDLLFGLLPLTTILYMGVAWKPEAR